MAQLRIDSKHQQVVDLLVSSGRVASVTGRAKTGPFTAMRQVVVLAAAVGLASNRHHEVETAGKLTIHDYVMNGAVETQELAFVLAYRESNSICPSLRTGT